MQNQLVSATVITGFLGAGKTTLIRRIIEQANGKRLALIVNEFGDIGIDGLMLDDCGSDSCRSEDIIELANGCICCTVADDFLPSMQALLSQTPPPDHIIIETSGLALPQPLVQAFNWPDIKARCRLDGVVTLVDGPALAQGYVVEDEAALEAQRAADEELDHESPIEELFEDQIGAANLILISKSDLCSPADITTVKDKLAKELDHPTAIVTISQDNVPVSAILGLNMDEEDRERASHSHHHHHHHDDDHDHHHDHDHGHDEFESFIVSVPDIAQPKQFEAQLSKLAATYQILRAKGALTVTGKALPYIVQAVGSRVDGYYANQSVSRTGALVVIGLKGLDQKAIEAEIAELIVG
ncbi:MAG: cobalamin biosynthesis protein CobW [Candidatus Puniceispirillaceae bacterium]